MYTRECPHCHEVFSTETAEKVYCSVHCRSEAENERRREHRARAQALSHITMEDPWPRQGPAITDNALLDGWTCADEAIAGPMACQQCEFKLCLASKNGVSRSKKEG